MSPRIMQVGLMKNPPFPWMPFPQHKEYNFKIEPYNLLVPCSQLPLKIAEHEHVIENKITRIGILYLNLSSNE